MRRETIWCGLMMIFLMSASFILDVDNCKIHKCAYSAEIGTQFGVLDTWLDLVLTQNLTQTCLECNSNT